jgi:hypothetical protein
MQDEERFGFEITNILILKRHQGLKKRNNVNGFLSQNIFRTLECFLLKGKLLSMTVISKRYVVMNLKGFAKFFTQKFASRIMKNPAFESLRSFRISLDPNDLVQIYQTETANLS